MGSGFRTTRPTRGFTLTELLVVIAIIAILATVVLASLQAAREKSKLQAARAQLIQIQRAAALLALDTGKSIGGCPIGGFNEEGNEVLLTDPQSGLAKAPTDFSVHGVRCQWTAKDATNWKGPYIHVPATDPWGQPYWYDPDYFYGQACGNPLTTVWIEVVVSGGPNRVNGGTPADGPYDCDDIYVQLK